MCFLSLLQTFPRVLELVIKGIPINSSRNPLKKEIVYTVFPEISAAR